MLPSGISIKVGLWERDKIDKILAFSLIILYAVSLLIYKLAGIFACEATMSASIFTVEANIVINNPITQLMIQLIMTTNDAFFKTILLGFFIKKYGVKTRAKKQIEYRSIPMILTGCIAKEYGIK